MDLLRATSSHFATHRTSPPLSDGLDLNHQQQEHPLARSETNSAKQKEGPVTKMKDLRLKAFEDVVEVVQVIVQGQKLLTRRQRDAPAGVDFADLRLKVYDFHMKTLVVALEALGRELHAKQPGGAPSNTYFNLAYDILKTYYKETQKTMKAPMLKEAVNRALPAGVESSDANGVEAFSDTVARKVIWLFKHCIPYEDF